MKKTFLLISMFVCIIVITNAQTNTFPSTGSAGIGTLSPNASSLLEMQSTTQGILIPRMSKNQRDAIVSPVEGLMIYQTNGSPGFYYYSGSDWKAISPKGVNKSLSNLTAPTAVNVDILPGTTAALDLGSVANAWKNIYTDGSVFLDGEKFIASKAGTGDFNTAIGASVLKVNTSGHHNTGNGFNALYKNTTGVNNFAAGSEALYNNISGSANIAIGSAALYKSISRSNLVAVGDSALYNNGTGATSGQATENTAIGSKALFANTTGRSNTATGNLALKANTTGFGNTATGSGALEANDTGYYNTGFGYIALTSNAGDENTAVGALALVDNISGDLNVAIGSQALAYNTTGGANTATGSRTMLSNTTGINNTATGGNALYNNTTGSGNTADGKGAGSYNNNNTYCTFLGYDADQSTGTDFTNSMALGNTSRITASNQVRIGNSSVTSIGGYAGWSNLSDGRYKKNINQNVPGLEFIKQLKPVTYTLDITGVEKFLKKDNAEEASGDKNTADKNTASLNQKSIAEKEKIIYTGFVAQDVEAAAKKINYDFSGVDKPQDENGLYGLRYSEFVVPLVKAVQELSAENDELRKRLEKIEALLAANSNMNDQSVKLNPLTAPGASSLEQNIPNPFKNSTVINYNLSKQYASAKILITDKAGNVLKEINLPAGRQGMAGSGKGNLQIDASTFAAGTYQYTLIVDGKILSTKQMMIAK